MEPTQELTRTIEHELDKVKVLATSGLWQQATTLFFALRDRCLEEQPPTLDPFEVPLADTSDRIPAHLRQRLEAIGVFYVGQLANIPLSELTRITLHPADWRQLRALCRQYGVKLKTK